MSTSSNQRADQPTVFGPGCHIKGEVAIEGDAAVFGSIEGAMDVTGNLEVGPEGGIMGGVSTGAMVIHGRVQGDVHCEGLLELNGRIEGDVVCGKIEIGSDATLVGNLRARIIAVKEGAIYRGEVIIGPEAMDERNSREAVDAAHHADDAANDDRRDDDRAGENGHHAEVKTTGSRSAVSGLLRRRHELLNK